MVTWSTSGRTSTQTTFALPGKFAAVLQYDPAKVAQELMILREWLDTLEDRRGRQRMVGDLSPEPLLSCVSVVQVRAHWPC